MESQFSQSDFSHAVISNVGCLAGVAVLLKQLIGTASIEHTMLVTVGTGLAVYLVLAVGYAAARSVVDYEPSTGPDNEAEDEAPGDEQHDEVEDAASEEASAAQPQAA